MLKKILVWLLLVMMPVPALAGEGKVFLDGETEPFPEGAELLTLRVCPLLGADCMLLTLGEHSMLIDAGTKANIDQIDKMLSDAGLTQVEYAFNSHPHDDHIGGIRPLLKEGFGMGTFFTFFPHDYTDPGVLQKPTVKALEEAGVPIVDLKTEDTIPFGDAILTAYRVPEGHTPDLGCNNLSAMLMIQYGECSILLTGDVENRTQPILTALYDLKADILKHPHHGLDNVHEAFLEEVDPEYVFFTHGSVDTVNAQKYLIQKGYARMTFATWGLITLQTDGEKWIVRQDIKPDLAEYARNYKIRE